MDETKTYIIEIPQVLGDETMIFLETDGDAVKSLFAIVEISDGGASVVENCYRSIRRSAECVAGGNRAETVSPHTECNGAELHDR